MPGAAASALFARAAQLRRRRTGRPLPCLLAFTDPARTPDPLALARALPRGAAIVYRAFGSADAAVTGARIAMVCRRRGIRLLIGADEALARRLRADGVHRPERDVGRRGVSKRTWIVTAAAHAPAALTRAAAAGIDAAIVSPVFPSDSPSAGAPIGVRRLRAWVGAARLPVYALGGVTVQTARTLPRGILAGIAAIGGLIKT